MLCCYLKLVKFNTPPNRSKLTATVVDQKLRNARDSMSPFSIHTSSLGVRFRRSKCQRPISPHELQKQTDNPGRLAKGYALGEAVYTKVSSSDIPQNHVHTA